VWDVRDEAKPAEHGGFLALGQCPGCHEFLQAADLEADAGQSLRALTARIPEPDSSSTIPPFDGCVLCRRR
jgi:hypothetical protein